MSGNLGGYRRRDLLRINSEVSIEEFQSGWFPEWQPIETAPRDGTEIISFEPSGHDVKEGWIELVSFRGVSDEDSPGVWEHQEGNRSNPTHWIPMLKGPKDEKCNVL